jgi:uncharacterized protein YrrD
MLIKASRIIGLPVFTINDGKRIDSIEDVIYDPFQNKIEAFLIEKSGWFSEARVISFGDLEGIGVDAALIVSPKQIRKLSDVEKNIEAIAKNDTYLTNTKIITENGVELGRVSDIYFDAGTGRVEEFEVSHGGLKYWKDGKKRVRISDIVTIGKDATIVRVYKKSEFQKADSSETLEEKVKKETNNFELNNSLSDETKVDDEKQNAHALHNQDVKTDETEKVPEKELSRDNDMNMGKIEEPEEQVEERSTAEPTGQVVKSELIERRKREAVGLYLMKNILTPEDKLLAKEGDMVTYRLLDNAEQAGVLDQILNNVSARIPLTA